MAIETPGVQEGFPRPSRKGLYIPFILLGLVIAIWSGIWFYAASKTREVAAGFMTREAERGRDWLCPNKSVSGYPFRIELSCDKPQLIEKGPDGLRREASLGALSLNARILSPGHFVAILSPPFIHQHDDLGEISLSWQTARASFRAAKTGFGDASVEFQQPQLTLAKSDSAGTKITAKLFEAHLRRSPGDVVGSDLVIKFADLFLPPLDSLTGNPDPLQIEFQTTAPGLLVEPSQRIEALLEAWRLRDGHARIIVAKLTKGSAALDLSGTLKLDAERRPEGSLQGRAKGLEALTRGMARRTGFDLGALFGRLAPQQGIPVALTIENGKLRFGPFSLIDVPPLY